VPGAGLIVLSLAVLIPLSILATYFVLTLFLIRFPDAAKEFYELELNYPQQQQNVVVTINSGSPGQMIPMQQLGQPMGQPMGQQLISNTDSTSSEIKLDTTGGETTQMQGGGLTMSCYSCQSHFSTPLGVSSGTVVACPTCNSPNQIP